MRILVSAGELSGDLHAAGVLSSLKNRGILVDSCGFGGPHLRAAGARLIADFSSGASGAVMGFFGALRQIPAAKHTLELLSAELRENRPDAVLIVDYPDFNLRLARIAHEANIPVFSFIIPKMWVWRASRIELFQRYIKHAFTILPFEPKWLADRGFPHSTYVGNPTIFEANRRPKSDRAALRHNLKIPLDAPVLLAMPGSRCSEVRYHAPIIEETYRLLAAQIAKLHLIVPAARSIAKHADLQRLAAIESVHVNHELPAPILMEAADLGLIKSGTSTLEAVAARLPSVMFFKTGAMSAWIVRHFVRNKDFSLPNIILPGTIQEFLQERATPTQLASALAELLLPNHRGATLARYERMLALMAGSDSALSPYEVVAEHLVKEIAATKPGF